MLAAVRSDLSSNELLILGRADSYPPLCYSERFGLRFGIRPRSRATAESTEDVMSHGAAAVAPAILTLPRRRWLFRPSTHASRLSRPTDVFLTENSLPVMWRSGSSRASCTG
jgi:hypothetical protein